MIQAWKITIAELWQKSVDLKVPALIPIALAILSLYLVIKNYRRKSGAYIRGSITPCKSRECDDEYVHEVVLENLKDRSVTLFGIYLRFGYNNYLEIEEFDDTPLTLKPFETYVKSFGPIEFYSVSDRRISLNGLFSRNVKKTLFLATSDGKYKVKSPMWRWNPIHEWFDNYLTTLIHPVRSTHKGKSIGGNMKFVVDFVRVDGTVEDVHVHHNDLNTFKNFKLTSEAIANKESFEQFLQKQRNDGKLLCKEFTVYDLDEWRAKKNEFYKGKTIEATAYGAFRYFIFGRLVAIYRNRLTKKNNKRMAQARQQPKPLPVQTSNQDSGEKNDNASAASSPNL